MDPESGKVVYRNTTTGEATTERPQQLPVGWERKTDPETGKVTFVNAETGEASLEVPQPLPSNWEAKVDPESGQVVYRNTVTGEATTERPQQLPPGWERENYETTGRCLKSRPALWGIMPMTTQQQIAIAIVPLARYWGPKGEGAPTIKAAWAIVQQQEAADSASG